MTTSKTNAVHKADVKVGSTYAVKVSGRIVPVTIQERKVEEGDFRRAKRVTWKGINLQTGKTVYVRSAAKLRYELVRDMTIGANPGDLKTATGGRWVRKDPPVVFELVEADRNRPDHLTGGAYFEPDPNCGFCLGHGSVDSGGSTPWGESIDVACSCIRVRRDVTPDELRVLCGEDAPEQCQEFEDESGRWRRV